MPRVSINPLDKEAVNKLPSFENPDSSSNDTESGQFSDVARLTSIEPCWRNTSGQRRCALPISFFPLTVISCRIAVLKHRSVLWYVVLLSFLKCFPSTGSGWIPKCLRPAVRAFAIVEYVPLTFFGNSVLSVLETSLYLKS